MGILKNAKDCPNHFLCFVLAHTVPWWLATREHLRSMELAGVRVRRTKGISKVIKLARNPMSLPFKD